MHAYLDREYPIMIGTGLKSGVVVQPGKRFAPSTRFDDQAPSVRWRLKRIMLAQNIGNAEAGIKDELSLHSEIDARRPNIRTKKIQSLLRVYMAW